MTLGNRRRSPEQKAAEKAAKADKWNTYNKEQVQESQLPGSAQVRAVQGVPAPVHPVDPLQTVRTGAPSPAPAPAPAAVAIEPGEGVQVHVEHADGSLSLAGQQPQNPTAQVQPPGMAAQNQVVPQGFVQQPGPPGPTGAPAAQPLVQPPAAPPVTPPSTLPAAQPGQSQIPEPQPGVPQPRQAEGFVMVATEEPIAQRASDLTVVLSAYLRPHKTGPQITGLNRQTIVPAQKIVVSGPHPASEEAIAGLARVHLTREMGPWFRFYIAVSAGTEYVAVIDDDADPSPRWLETAMDHLRKYNRDVVAAAGHILAPNGGMDYVGPPTQRPEQLTKVDIGRGAWVCSRGVMESALRKQLSPITGWAEALSFAAYQARGSTVVLPYGPDAAGLQSPPSTDTVSLSSRPDIGAARTEVFSVLCTRGWKMLYELAAAEAEEATRRSAVPPIETASPEASPSDGK